ncbi:MAG: hypothetical protein RLZ98_1911 [Pseudomonadota bacterium]
MVNDVLDHPVNTLRSEHRVQLEACQTLEAIADALPAVINPLVIESSRNVLDKVFLSHIRFEEQQLFPRLRYRLDGNESLLKILDQLSREHHRDECAVMEVSEELAELAGGRKCRNPEMLGYMLRGFFEGQRSHIELENSTILPIAQTVLTVEDLSGMSSWLGHNDQIGIMRAAERNVEQLTRR